MGKHKKAHVFYAAMIPVGVIAAFFFSPTKEEKENIMLKECLENVKKEVAAGT